MESAQFLGRPLPESDCFHDEKLFFNIWKGPLISIYVSFFQSTYHTPQSRAWIHLFWLSSHRHCQTRLGPSKLSFLQAELTLSSAGSSSACCLLKFPWTFQQSCYSARLKTAWISEKASPFPEAGHWSSWNFKPLLLACFSSLPRFLWTAAQFWHQPSPEYGIIQKSDKSKPFCLLCIIDKTVGHTGPRIDLCGTPHFTPGKLWPINHNPESSHVTRFF